MASSPPATPSQASSPAAAGSSSSPFGSFSPSNFFSSKLDAARTAVGAAQLSVEASAGMQEAVAKVEGLASPVRAQVDAALSRASSELQSRVAAVEAELREQARRMDAELQARKEELSQAFERERKQLEASVREKAEATVAGVRAEYEAKKKELQDRALLEFEKVIVKVLDEKLLPEVQKAALDPLMPLFIQELICDAIVATWPDVKEEFFDAWQNLVLEFEPVPEGEPVRWCPNFLKAAMCSFLYHTFPYDRSIWWQLRSVSWWFWNLVAIFPLYGVQAAYFIFLFCCLDKRDEFQMVNFILQFKGLQFITLGIINCMVGGAAYYGCVSVDYAGEGVTRATSGVTRTTHDDVYIHNCDKTGPAALPGFYTDMVLFLLQSLTIWTAMACLPGTRKKGLRQLTPNSPPRHFQASALTAAVPTGAGGVGGKPVYQGMGGKLRQAVFFDAFLVLLVCAVATLLLFTRPYRVTTSGAFSHFEWLFKEDIFWLKTLYGLASFPFAIFLVPFVSNLLLHTRPTGYNRAGECVPLDPKVSDEVPLVLKQRNIGGAGMQTVQVSPSAGATQQAWAEKADQVVVRINQAVGSSNKVAQAPV